MDVENGLVHDRKVCSALFKRVGRARGHEVEFLGIPSNPRKDRLTRLDYGK